MHIAAPAVVAGIGVGVWGFFFFLAGSFMVWAGIGELKNKKHFLLPLSVIFTALLFALPLGFLPLEFSKFYVYFYIGILPLLFIAPILTKGWVDQNEAAVDKI